TLARRICVGGEILIAPDERQCRRQIDDGAAPAAQHLSKSKLAAEAGTFQVDSHDEAPGLLRAVGHRAVAPFPAAYADNVKEDIQSAEARRRLLHGPL